MLVKVSRFRSITHIFGAHIQTHIHTHTIQEERKSSIGCCPRGFKSDGSKIGCQTIPLLPETHREKEKKITHKEECYIFKSLIWYGSAHEHFKAMLGWEFFRLCLIHLLLSYSRVPRAYFIPPNNGSHQYKKKFRLSRTIIITLAVLLFISSLHTLLLMLAHVGSVWCSDRFLRVWWNFVYEIIVLSRNLEKNGKKSKIEKQEWV